MKMQLEQWRQLHLSDQHFIAYKDVTYIVGLKHVIYWLYVEIKVKINL